MWQGGTQWLHVAAPLVLLVLGAVTGGVLGALPGAPVVALPPEVVGHAVGLTIVDRKLRELAEQQRRITVARAVLEHAGACPSDDLVGCPRLRSIVESRCAAFHWKTVTRECTEAPAPRQ